MQDEPDALNYTNMVFSTMYEVLTDFEIIIGSAEIYIGGSTAFALFFEG